MSDTATPDNTLTQPAQAAAVDPPVEARHRFDA